MDSGLLSSYFLCYEKRSTSHVKFLHSHSHLLFVFHFICTSSYITHIIHIHTARIHIYLYLKEGNRFFYTKEETAHGAKFSNSDIYGKKSLFLTHSSPHFLSLPLTCVEMRVMASPMENAPGRVKAICSSVRLAR